jgi:hypothetical protein
MIRDKICAGAPEDRIEITPEMKVAGANVLAERYDLIGDFMEEITAEKVFKAMLSASSEAYSRVKR